MNNVQEGLRSTIISDPSTWVDQHGDYLYRYALMRGCRRELAENLVQETFLAALKSRHSFSGRSSEKTWMVGILKHKMIDEFRESHYEKCISELQIEPEQAMDEFYDAITGHQWLSRDWMPEQVSVLNSKEFWDVFRSCLNRLPERAASAFMMREFDRRSTKCICLELGVTPTNLWVILHRARFQLRGLLEKNWFQKGENL